MASGMEAKQAVAAKDNPLNDSSAVRPNLQRQIQSLVRVAACLHTQSMLLDDLSMVSICVHQPAQHNNFAQHNNYQC